MQASLLNASRSCINARPGKAGNKVEAITNITALSSTREKTKKDINRKAKKKEIKN